VTQPTPFNSEAFGRRPRNAGLPPHDVVAEESVLAALLLDPEAIGKVIGLLDPADFFRPINGAIFEACLRLAERRVEITIATVAHYLDEEGTLDADGPAYLMELGGKYFTAVAIEAHAGLVSRDAHYRRLIDAAGRAAQLAYRGGPEPSEVQAAIEAEFSTVGAGTRRGRFETASDVVERLLDPDRQARQVRWTGLRALDRTCGGFGLGELVGIGAHTSHGKTALATQIALNQAQAGTPVGYITVEGNDEKIIERMAGTYAGTTRSAGERRGWLPADRERYEEALRLVGMMPLYFPPERATPRSVSAVCAWITTLARSSGVEVFYLDHIDDMDVERTPGDSLATSYQLALRRLQNTAARENVSIVFLSQVNRGSEEQMPSMRSLRESGAKEELSQLVLMLYLDYRDGMDEVAREYAGGHRARFLQIQVAKNTAGEVGAVPGRGRYYLPDGAEEALPPYLLNFDSMAIEEVHEAGARPPAFVQPGLVAP